MDPGSQAPAPATPVARPAPALPSEALSSARATGSGGATGDAAVGIGGARAVESVAGRGGPGWKSSDQLSESEAFGHQELEDYSRDLRSGRRTLTTTVSPLSSLGKPLRYGVHSIQNMRREMEDAHRAVLGDEGWSPSASRPCSREGMEASLGSMSYFAIFDGHAGPRAAEFAGERLCELLASDRNALLSEPSEALRKALVQTEEEWLQRARSHEMMDGTTAAVALVDRVGQRCIVANIGDSEIVLGSSDDSGQTDVRVLTEVHHLKRSPSEVERVSKVGGRIWHGRLGHPKISPQVLSLSVSRAIGDLFFKDAKFTDGIQSGLSAEAYISTVDICSRGTAEEFLVIGCDGLWDTVKYQEAAEFVLDMLNAKEDPQTITEGLVRRAREKGSSDNITVMVVVL